MLTPLLEKLIVQGKAKAATFTFGGSGVATIPCPDDEYIIIHHFDYWHFLDEPEDDAAVRPSSTFEFDDPGGIPSTISWQETFNGANNDFSFSIGDGTPAPPYSPFTAPFIFNWFADANAAAIQAKIDAYEATLTPIDVGFGWHTVCTAYVVGVSANFTTTGAGGFDFTTSVPAVIQANLTAPGFVIVPPAASVSVSYQVSGLPAFPVLTPFDNTDVPATLIDFQNTLDLQFAPGNYIVSSMVFGAGVWTVIVEGIPGTSLNGISPTVVTSPVAVVAVTPFAGGIDGFSSLESQLEHSAHIIEFRSGKSRNHYAVRENVVINRTIAFNDIGDLTTVTNMSTTGYYAKDCYLVHTANVQIDIWRIPQPHEWAIPLGLQNLPPRSQEFKEPVGYGIPPSPSSTAVRQIFFNGALLTGQYLPLTEKRDDLPILDYREQFRPDVEPFTQLENPQNVNTATTNKRRYPLVNVDYVSMNKNEMKTLMDSL